MESQRPTEPEKSTKPYKPSRETSYLDMLKYLTAAIAPLIVAYAVAFGVANSEPYSDGSRTAYNPKTIARVLTHDPSASRKEHKEIGNRAIRESPLYLMLDTNHDGIVDQAERIRAYNALKNQQPAKK
ncbi:MAG: hypothetical protein WC796_03040 [Candidatus Pacearchaeota archaeon]|jgi:hypothetical protein